MERDGECLIFNFMLQSFHTYKLCRACQFSLRLHGTQKCCHTVALKEVGAGLIGLVLAIAAIL